tara:strand:+ start:327 stop:590 length:264 start_codon:yes stop_codon:yes gene_type:complete
MRELNIDEEIIRKGALKEVYQVREKKFINNILHYLIKTNQSNPIILSKYAIDKDFSSKDIIKNNNKKTFLNLLKSRIDKIILSSRHS